MGIVQFYPEDYSGVEHPEQMTAYMRLARVVAVNPTNGSCIVEWFDHPGQRNNIPLTQSAQGIYELPPVGSIVLIGFDTGYYAYIVRFVSIGYQDQIGKRQYKPTGGVSPSLPQQIRKLNPGDKLIVSHRDSTNRTASDTIETPVTTGAELYLSNTGEILMTNINGERWHMDTKNSVINQQSANQQVITEAGILDFGLVKREYPQTLDPEQTETHIISTDGDKYSGECDALTEFRLRIIETADTNPETPPATDSPLVELTIGTKMRQVGDGATASHEIELTDQDIHAVGSQEIAIQLKSQKSGQEFEFTVDKAGNITMRTTGQVKIEAQDQIEVSSDTGVTVNSDTIRIGGDGTEQPIVLKEFLNSYYSDLVSKFNSHTHVVPQTSSGVTTSQPPVTRARTGANNDNDVVTGRTEAS